MNVPDIEPRENWRIITLVVLLVLTTVVLFPIGPVDDTAATNETVTQSDPTNLNYGIELAGGTRVRAPMIGVTAPDVPASPNQSGAISRGVASELGLEGIDVRVRPQGPDSVSVEVFREDVSRRDLASALQEMGYQVNRSDVRTGVTAETRSEVGNTLSAKINQGGLTGGQATVIRTAGGDHFVVVEVPNANRSEVIDIVGDRGVVRVVAQVRKPDGTTINRTVLTGADFPNAGTARNDEVLGWGVSTSVDETAAANFSDQMNELGFTSANGVSNCDQLQDTGPGSYCLVTTLDGDVVRYNSMGSSLAQDMRQESWRQDPTFFVGTGNASQAEELELALNTGSLPTRLDIDEGTSYYLQPSLAERFKGLALLTGIVAWLGVAAAVFVRYGRIRVSAPMLFAAGAEVYLLLGFAVLVDLALDLSHIAGLIAVIGTGVDDLIIIADEIMQREEVATGRVFQSRFRKAFWVIGAAAATTIIAMSPLTVLSLGDLTGFAIITIVGVLIGVIVTRPAYGDILRNLVLREQRKDD